MKCKVRIVHTKCPWEPDILCLSFSLCTEDSRISAKRAKLERASQQRPAHRGGDGGSDEGDGGAENQENEPARKRDGTKKKAAVASQRGFGTQLDTNTMDVSSSNFE